MLIVGLLGLVLAAIGGIGLASQAGLIKDFSSFNALGHYAIAMVAVGTLMVFMGGFSLCNLMKKIDQEPEPQNKQQAPRLGSHVATVEPSSKPKLLDGNLDGGLKTLPACLPEFLEGEIARIKIKEHDDYLGKMTAYDRRVRLKKECSAAEFVTYYQSQVLSWSVEEKQAIQTDLTLIFAKLVQLKIHLPPTLNFVKTTGAEELAGTHGYCRRGTIVFCGQYRPHLLAHELFHIISQYNPEKRDLLYRMLGFMPCPEAVSFPSNAIINPDFLYDPYFIEITQEGRKVRGVPFDRISNPDRASFSSLEHLLLLEDGTLIPFQHNPSFLAQVGENTHYTDSPEEILAENFALWVSGRKATTPRVIEEMIKILTLGTYPDNPRG